MPTNFKPAFSSSLILAGLTSYRCLRSTPTRHTHARPSLSSSPLLSSSLRLLPLCSGPRLLSSSSPPALLSSSFSLLSTSPLAHSDMLDQRPDARGGDLWRSSMKEPA
eukprot:2695374-Rhodomonas_salina.1